MKSKDNVINARFSAYSPGASATQKSDQTGKNAPHFYLTQIFLPESEKNVAATVLNSARFGLKWHDYRFSRIATMCNSKC